MLSNSDPVESLHHAQLAADLQPNNLQIQINLAEAFALNGQVEQAWRHMDALAKQLEPDDPTRLLLIERIEELKRERP